MNTIDKKNSTLRGTVDPRNPTQNTDDSNALFNPEQLDITTIKDSDDNAREIAERGYTIRNGYDPNKPNPDQDQIKDDNLDDLDDDFHSNKDLEDSNDAIYEVGLEDEELDANGNELNEVNDEFDNPSDDFNETEEDLEDIDQDDEEEQEYSEDDVQEKEQDEVYPDNDPRKF